MLPTVVLLHGLGRQAGSLDGIGQALRDAGFETWSCDYPSTSTTIQEAASYIAERLHRDLRDRPLHAVTHSMGGILVRHLGEPYGIPWKRIVMLAPPNRGSRLARAFASNPLFRWAFGPAGCELGNCPTDEQRWPFPPAPFAVIAGTNRTSWWNPTSWFSGMWLPDADNDGTVLVEETKLDGMSAFATVDATHSLIMDSAIAQRMTIRFLVEGVF